MTASCPTTTRWTSSRMRSLTAWTSRCSMNHLLLPAVDAARHRHHGLRVDACAAPDAPNLLSQAVELDRNPAPATGGRQPAVQVFRLGSGRSVKRPCNVQDRDVEVSTEGISRVTCGAQERRRILDQHTLS